MARSSPRSGSSPFVPPGAGAGPVPPAADPSPVGVFDDRFDPAPPPAGTSPVGELGGPHAAPPCPGPSPVPRPTGRPVSMPPSPGVPVPQSAGRPPSVPPSAGVPVPLPPAGVADGLFSALDLPPATTPAALAETVCRLAVMVPAELADAEVVELVAVWERVVSAATALQAEVIREVVARTPGRAQRYVVDEIAAVLATTHRGGELKVALAEAVGFFPALDVGLRDGRIDARKAAVIAEEVVAAGLAGPGAAGVVDRAVQRGPGCTAPQLRTWLRREAVAADPVAAQRQSRAARAGRRVELTPANDSMAWIAALLPAADAAAVFTAVDALADQGGCAWDGRTADQRRADAFADVFVAMLGTGTGPHGPLPKRHGLRPTIQVTVAATTLLGLNEHPAELAGYGPIPAALARELAQDGTWRRILTDDFGQFLQRGTGSYRPGADLTGTVIARDTACVFPGCRQPGGHCQLDHEVPFDHDRPAVDQTVEHNLSLKCLHHHQAKTRGGWSTGRDRRTGIAWWTSPLGVTYHRSPVPLVYTPGPTTGDDPAGHRRPPPRTYPLPDEPPPF